jgi:hypothetical protein
MAARRPPADGKPRTVARYRQEDQNASSLPPSDLAADDEAIFLPTQGQMGQGRANIGCSYALP